MGLKAEKILREKIFPGATLSLGKVERTFYWITAIVNISISSIKLGASKGQESIISISKSLAPRTAPGT